MRQSATLKARSALSSLTKPAAVRDPRPCAAVDTLPRQQVAEYAGHEDAARVLRQARTTARL